MKRKLGEILVTSGVVTRFDIDEALQDQSAGEPTRLGDLLVALGKLTPLQLALALSEQYGVPFTELPPVPSSVLELVPLDFQRKHRFVPLKFDEQGLSIAMADLSAATSDVLPVLKRRFARVQILVAASDEIDAVHAALLGEDGPAVLELPDVAPSIAPVATRAGPAPTAEELFGSLQLEPPVEALEPLGFDGHGEAVELQVPASSGARRRVAARTAEEEPFFFEATAPSLHDSTGGSWVEPALDEEAPLEGEGATVREELLTAAAGLRDAPDRREEPRPFSDAPPRATPTPFSLGAEDAPFFAASGASRSIGAVADEDFVPGVAASSPSSLAQLVIEPTSQVISSMPPVDLEGLEARPPARAATAAPGVLPDWLASAGDEQGGAGWTGALDHLAPSRLILAVTRALLRRGALTEQDILDADRRK